MLRFLNPLAVALTYIVLWRLGVFSVRTAAAFAAWNVVVAIVVFRPVYPRHGLRGRAVRSPGRRSGTASAPKSLGSATRSSPGVRLVYGDEFGGSVRPLLYLLPGCVLWPASSILFDGMLAANRPLGGAVPMGVGLVLNVSGLVLFLAAGGIEAAAIVSSVSYGIVFIPAAIHIAGSSVCAGGNSFPPLRAARGGRGAVLPLAQDPRRAGCDADPCLELVEMTQESPADYTRGSMQ